MKIAILGATSEIAKDLVKFLGHLEKIEFFLFSRRSDEVDRWISENNLSGSCFALEYKFFSNAANYMAIINFIGAGDPIKIYKMGAELASASFEYDRLAIAYLSLNPSCKYIYLSSGVAYGVDFRRPVDEKTKLKPLNNKDRLNNVYVKVKMDIEKQHRMLYKFDIVDLRVFNYFSATQDLNSGFFVSNLMRSLISGGEFEASSVNIFRDYLSQEDFSQLIVKILGTAPRNGSVDCFSKAPISKYSLLQAMNKEYGLRYHLSEKKGNISPTGYKVHYYSKNYLAKEFGYKPSFSSLDNILRQAKLLL